MADLNEEVEVPTNPFSRSFVENSGPAFALIGGTPSWPEFSDFLEFFHALNLQHFTPDEILFLGGSNKSGSCKGKNNYPPKEKWDKIKNTAIMIDAIRKELGAPIRILSCYRSEDYNACVGGASKSLHTEFNAIDFTCSQSTPEVWRRVANKIRASDAKFKGGIGTYSPRRFVHIDTRGTNKDWTG
jgi:N-acetylmuramoyl-L-alanine amidase